MGTGAGKGVAVWIRIVRIWLARVWWMVTNDGDRVAERPHCAALLWRSSSDPGGTGPRSLRYPPRLFQGLPVLQIGAVPRREISPPICLVGIASVWRSFARTFLPVSFIGVVSFSAATL